MPCCRQAVENDVGRALDDGVAAMPWHWAGRWIGDAGGGFSTHVRVLASVRCAGRSGGQFGIERVGTYRQRKKRRRGLLLVPPPGIGFFSGPPRTVARCAGQS